MRPEQLSNRKKGTFPDIQVVHYDMTLPPQVGVTHCVHTSVPALQTSDVSVMVRKERLL